MSKFFKTLLIMLVLVPFLCLVTACGGTPSNNQSQQGEQHQSQGDDGQGGQQGETQQQMYAALLSAITKMAQKTSYTSVGTSYDTFKSTTTLQTWDDEEEDWVVDEEAEPVDPTENEEKSKSVTTLNAETGEYANNYYVWIEPEEESEEEGHYDLVLEDSEYIVRLEAQEEEDEDRFVHLYSNSYNDELYADYVSQGHATHKFNLANYAKYMTLLVRGETIEASSEYLVSVMPTIAGLMLLDITDAAYDITCEPTATIEKDGDLYTISISLAITATPKVAEEEDQDNALMLIEAPEGEASYATLESTMAFSITYTSDEVTGYTSTMDRKITTISEDDGGSSIKSYPEVTNRVVVVEETHQERAATITYAYTAEEMPEDFGDYQGIEAEKADVAVKYYLDGILYTTYYYEWGEDVTAEIIGLEVDEYGICDNTTVTDWYKDAACTQPIDPEEDEFVYESWETGCFYAKSVADEGYVFIVMQFGYTLSEQQAEAARMYGADIDEEGFITLDHWSFTTETENEDNGFFVEDMAYPFYVDYLDATYPILKVTVNGVELTEDITEFEDGQTYLLKGYLDYAHPVEEEMGEPK